jgi:outer membrane usher protein
VGLVGQGGRIEVNVAADSGRLGVRWGDEATDQCTLAYSLPPEASTKTVAFTRTEGVCRRPQRQANSENPGSHDVQ